MGLTLFRAENKRVGFPFWYNLEWGAPTCNLQRATTLRATQPIEPFQAGYEVGDYIISSNDHRKCRRSRPVRRRQIRSRLQTEWRVVGRPEQPNRTGRSPLDGQGWRRRSYQTAQHDIIAAASGVADLKELLANI